MTDTSGMKSVFKGLVFEVLRKRIQANDGAERELEFVKARDVVRVYPVSKDRQKIFLINEWRPGEERADLRVISGGIEAGENCRSTARRELAEEGGIAAREFKCFHKSRQSLKQLNFVYHVVALDADWHKSQSLDSMERIETRVVPLKDVPDMVWNGAFAEDIVSFAMLKLIRQLDSPAGVSALR